jgi:YbbR domain-containing protein
MVITNRVPEAIRVRLSGPRTVLAGINPQRLSVALGLEGIQPGISTFENLGSRIELPKRIDVTYASPSSISVEADVKVRKALRVRARIKGEPMAGKQIADIRTDPVEVEVEGAEKILRRLAEVPTEVVDVTGLEESITRPVELALPDPSLRRVSRDTVRLAVVLKEGKR